MTQASLERAKRLSYYIWLMGDLISRVQSHCCQAGWDLSIQEIKTVEFLGIHGPNMMRNLADHLQLAVSSTTALVDRLEDKGVVRRHRSEEDRRVVEVALTDEGTQAFSETADACVAACAGLLDSLEEEEQDTLLELLGKITQNTQKGWNR